MIICFIFRDPAKGGKSIEEIFRNLSGVLSGMPGVTVRGFTYCQQESLWSNIRRLRSIRADVYHITGDIHYLTTFLWDRRTVLSIHDIGHYKNLRGIRKWLFKWWWLKIPVFFARRVTTVSEFTLMDLARVCPGVEKKTVVIYNPLPALFKAVPKPHLSDPPALLQVGAGHNKNLVSVIAAIESIRCRLMIIGKLSERQRAMLEEKNIDYVNYFDLAYEQVYETYCQADIIVFVSTHEGFGMPVIEAQGVGRPVVTSPVCSIPEIAADSALIVDPHDIPGITRAIELLLTDPEKRQYYVNRGNQNVERFRQQEIFDQYYQLYLNIAGH